MPTYEYVCSKCGHNFELFQSMRDEALKVCPKEKCAKQRWGKGKVQRAIGAGAGLIFKGSGFYITDYRSEGYKEAAKKESSAKESSGAEKSKSSETKSSETKSSETKSESKAGESKTSESKKTDSAGKK